MRPKTRDELAAAIEESLRAADDLGLTDVGIKLNDAIVALDGDGLPPPEAAAPSHGLMH